MTNDIESEDAKIGLADKSGRLVVDYIYDELNVFDIYNHMDKNIIDGFKDDISPVKLIPAKLGEKWGAIDLEGNVVVDFIYESINSSSTLNSALISNLDDKYGIIDLEGNIVVDFKYDTISASGNVDRYIMSVDGKWGIIDKEGGIIVEPTYENIKATTSLAIDIGNNRVLVKSSGKYGVIDLDGNIIINTVYDNIEFEENYIMAEINNTKEYIENNGNRIVIKLNDQT